jgi:hypothetical protein
MEGEMGVMRRLGWAAVCAILLLVAARGAWAQAANTYDPRLTFAPLTLPDAANEYRTASGVPGPAYWQNRADYKLTATLDAAKKELRGTAVITYTNNSPDTLTSLWLQLDQNRYREDARAAHDGRGKGEHTDGMVLESMAVDGATAHFVVSDTRMQIVLAKPLAHGGRVVVRIRYHFTEPEAWGGRTSWGPSQNGDIFDMAQWYPRMCVYDDLHGWDTLPYLEQEFYLEYGTFDYAVTVPAEMIVAGTGELVNATEVLTAEQRARLAQARTSDRTVMIRTADEVAREIATPKADVKTWRFHMERTRDVAFSASRAFVWDAARVNLPNGKHALAMSFYPVESAGAAKWGRSTEYLKDAVERFSQHWYVFPYPVAINVAGPTDGMEYPGMCFDGTDAAGKELFWLTAHEIGHTWFPMTVGFNERRHAWMDEGFNTFIDTLESDEFNRGEYAPKRDSEYAPGGGNPADEMVPWLKDAQAPPILTRADVIPEHYRHAITYFKSAYGLTLLREQILGPERFDEAFRRFIAAWAFKHPSPSDFFRAMASEGGEDLDYFWRGWYLNNWTLDLRVDAVMQAADNTTVTVGNHGQLVLPSVVEITFAGGEKRREQLAAEAWIQRQTVELVEESAQAVTSVVIDPEQKLPDVDRKLMVWAK